MNPYLLAFVYAVLGMVLLPLLLSLFKTPFGLADVVLAALAGGAASLVPVVGGLASFVAMVAVLNWRLPARLYPDILVPVFIARLAMLPVLLVIRLHHGP